MLVSFLEVSAANFKESAVLAESAALSESAAAELDLLLQAAKETAIAKAKTPTLNEFFMFEFKLYVNYFLVSFFVVVVFTTVLTVVSFLVLSFFMVVSFLRVSTVFVVAESVLPESADDPLLWPLQAANDTEIASASAVIFNVFFMGVLV